MPAIAFRSAATPIVALLVLAGCGSKSAPVPNGNSSVATVTIGNVSDGDGTGNALQSVAINVPGFSAKVDVPNLDLGSNTTDIDGMKLFQGTRVTGVKIIGRAGDGSGGDTKGQVEMGFSAPGTPDQVVGWYRDQAQHTGWRAVPPSGANQFEATKQGNDKEHFALQVAAAGAGSTGHFFDSGE